MSEPAGNVTVAAPLVLAIIRAVLREVPGVAALADTPRGVFGPEAHLGPGVALVFGASGAIIDCALIAEPGAPLASLAATARMAIASALHELAGIQVEIVNISIDDIAPAMPVRKTLNHG